MLNSFPRFYSGVENKDEHWLKIFYSAFYFAVAFILIHYSGHAWSAANAWDFGYSPTFSYDKMESLAGEINWTVSKVANVYLAPPIWGLFLSIVAVILFRTTEGSRIHLKTMLYWISVNGFLLYFSYLVTGILSGQDYSSTMYTGFASYYAWLEWSPAKIYGILTVQILVSLPYAILFSKGVLQLNYSRLLAARSNGKAMIFTTVIVLPFLIGSVLIMLTTYPMDFGYQVVRLLCYLPVFVIVFLGMGFHRAKHISIVKGGLRPVPLFGIIALIIMLLGSRFGLSLHVEPFW
jgi:hypothetical protein